jgi:bifunctional enzyme CysN/CysC
VLDGDNIRFGLSSDLGFAPEDRVENIRRVGEVAKLFASAGLLVITAFISPYRADRDRARSIAPNLFHEVHIAADIATCEKRDPKGLYKKARAGEIKDFTGISAPYEEPVTPEVMIETVERTVNESVADLMAYAERNFSMVNRNGGGR